MVLLVQSIVILTKPLVEVSLSLLIMHTVKYAHIFAEKNAVQKF